MDLTLLSLTIKVFEFEFSVREFWDKFLLSVEIRMSLAENVCLCLYVCLSPCPLHSTLQWYRLLREKCAKLQVQNDLLLQRSVIILNSFRDEHSKQLILGRSLIAEGMKVIANGHYLNEQIHCTPPPTSEYLYVFIYVRQVGFFFFFTSTCSWVLDGGRKWECLEKIPQTGPKPGIAYWDTCPPTLVTHSFGRINAPALTDRATDRLAVSYWLPLWPADYWPPALTSWATDHRPDQQKNYRRP